jgi:hypothetical protein
LSALLAFQIAASQKQLQLIVRQLLVASSFCVNRTAVTFDIDVLAITPNSQRQEFLQNAAKGSVLHRKHGVYLDLVTVIQAYPEDYVQRLTEMYSGQLKKIRLFAVEPHDLALMKLERNAERDRVDVMFLASQGLVTASELDRRYRAEMRSYIGVPERSTDITL